MADEPTTTPQAFAPPKIANLTAALLRAQARVVTIEKDATNAHHRYRYVSSEAMLATTRNVLAEEGIAVLPTSTTIRFADGVIRTPVGRELEEVRGHAVLWRSYLVVHAESGECMCASQEWPIVPEKGRPLDKAAAGADTVSLAYFLRDLLLIPRVDKGTDLDDSDRDRPASMITATQVKTIVAELTRTVGENENNRHMRSVAKILGRQKQTAITSLTEVDAAYVIGRLAGAPTKTRGEPESDEGTPVDEGTPEAEETDSASEPSTEPSPQARRGDETTVEPVDKPEDSNGGRRMIETWQTRAITAVLDELGIGDDRRLRREIIESAIGRTISEPADVTYEEAKTAIEKLNAEVRSRQDGQR